MRVAEEGEPVSIRKPRADAERNRARLLETAKAVFAEKGAESSLDEIARKASVGAGTLYRHFPTRDALVEAVYRNESDQLLAASIRLAETHAPLAAMREWLLLFVDYMVTKRGMSAALDTLAGGTSDLYSASSAQLKQAIDALAGRAAACGDIRTDLRPFDLLRALAGVAAIGAGPDGAAAAETMVDILLAGLRTRS